MPSVDRSRKKGIEIRMTLRHDWIACIKSKKNPKQGCCGRDITMEFSFVNIEHAWRQGNRSRFEVCTDCIDVLGLWDY